MFLIQTLLLGKIKYMMDVFPGGVCGVGTMFGIESFVAVGNVGFWNLVFNSNDLFRLCRV